MQILTDILANCLSTRLKFGGFLVIALRQIQCQVLTVKEFILRMSLRFVKLGFLTHGIHRRIVFPGLQAVACELWRDL